MGNPNNKIGIKTLTREQIRTSLLNYEMIDVEIYIESIEMIR